MSDQVTTENQTHQDNQVDEMTVEAVNSNQMIKTAKAAIFDAFKVLKLILQDPAMNVQEAIITLADTRTFYAGIVLCLLFTLACWITVQRVFSLLAGFLGLWSLGLAGGYGGSLGVGDHIRILLSATVPVLSMIGVLWGIKKTFKGAGNYKQFTLVTGIALTPITFFLFLFWLSNNSAVELIMLSGFFCTIMLILLINAALLDVMRLSARNSFFIVPSLLIISICIARIVLGILYRG
jgi:hypothetical protein